MLFIVTAANAHLHWNKLASMHHLRRKVFSERLKWGVTVINGLEIDQFDLPEAHYLLHVDDNDSVDACTRLLPTTGPNLLGDVFPGLVNGPAPRHPLTWESTRFCADHDRAPRNIAALLMAGMLEFGIYAGLARFVSVSDIRMEPIMRRAGWDPKRLGSTIATGTDTAAAERLTVSQEYLIRVRKRAAVEGNIIRNLHELDREAAVA